MIGAALTGLITAIAVVLPQYLHFLFPQMSWSSSVFILGVGAIAVLLQKFVIDRLPGNPNYDGLADLFIHVQFPSSPYSPLRWMIHGAISFLLTLFGGCIGPEGAAIEFSQAMVTRMRSRSVKWFEEMRRTDVAASLAGGVAAAFGAPFAGVLLPIELGIGGRALNSAVAAIIAFLVQRVLVSQFYPEFLDFSSIFTDFAFIGWREWAGFVGIGVVCGVMGVLVVRFICYTQESIISLFQTQVWMRVLAGAMVLALLYYIYKPVHFQPWYLLEQLLWERRSVGEALILLVTQMIGLALILSGFGSAGTFWSLFILGGFVGYAYSTWLVGGGTHPPGYFAFATLAGASAMWGAALGTPWSGAVLAFEISQDFNVLLPCLLTGLLARQVRSALRTPSFVELNMQIRGLPLKGGRSALVLESISIRDAMVTDHESVHEHTPISELHARIFKTRYPFLPVVDSNGVYQGLLTIDMIQENWSENQEKENSPLRGLVVARDVLYRSGFHVPTIQINDKISTATDLFSEIPCLPVLADDRKIAGLLFVHNVRFAYDREIARKSAPELFLTF